MDISLLKTKMMIPPQRPGIIVRPHLVKLLNEGQNQRYKLTLISAKAGSGKTTLVSEWVHVQTRPAVWLSLDSNDNDPLRFIKYLLTALDGLGINIKTTQKDPLDNTPLPPPEDFISELINLV